MIITAITSNLHNHEQCKLLFLTDKKFTCNIKHQLPNQVCVISLFFSSNKKLVIKVYLFINAMP